MTAEKLKKTLEQGIDTGHYHILSLINNKENISSLWTIPRIKAWREALIRKLLINEINNEYILTEKAKELLIYIDSNNNNENSVIVNEEKEEKIEEKPSFKAFCNDLYISIENKIFELTKRKNYKNPSSKYLKPSTSKDLSDRLSLFYKRGYKAEYKDIKRAIIQYTEDTVQGKNKYALTLEYFICKKLPDGTYKSEMVSFIEMMEDIQQENKEKIDIKKLF